jgi:hypothetical protein
MGRPRRTDRHDDTNEFEDDAPLAREAARDSEREDDLPMFNDAVESPFHVPREDWPDGMAMRWISVEVTGAPDNRNWSLKTAAHWSPVPRGKYKYIDARFPNIPIPGGGADTGMIMHGGLCLCERDIRYNIRDQRMQQKATEEAGRTIDAYVEGGNPNFPRRDFGTSPVQYERGVRPAAFKE